MSGNNVKNMCEHVNIKYSDLMSLFLFQSLDFLFSFNTKTNDLSVAFHTEK